MALEDIGWGTAEHWMRMQAAYEIAQARRRAARMMEPCTGADGQGGHPGAGRGDTGERGRIPGIVSRRDGTENHLDFDI